MDAPIYWIAWSVVKFLQLLPLGWVARLGRAGGAVAYLLDGRHRRVAIRNLTQCFGAEKSPGEIRALARENFRRIGEAYCSAVKTSAMSWEQLHSRVELVGAAWFLDQTPGGPRPSAVFAVGHFGNFEIYARFAQMTPLYQCATTYRGLRPPALDRLLQSLRATSGCHYFERRTDAAALKAWMAPEGRVLGLLADQHAGRSGVRVPFFGRDCATTTAPAVLALRYNQPLYVAICFRVAPGRWRIEVSGKVPTRDADGPRSVEAITTDLNRLLEAAVRRDPANWFWVHNRWKPDKLPPPRAARARSGAETSAAVAGPEVEALEALDSPSPAPGDAGVGAGSEVPAPSPSRPAPSA